MPRLPRNLHVVTTSHSPDNAIRKTRNNTQQDTSRVLRLATRNDDGGRQSAVPATKIGTHLLKTSQKYCDAKRLLTCYETSWNVTKCHAYHAKRGCATSETSKSDHSCKTRHRHGHTPLTRPPADGCDRLRTVANVNGTSSEHTLNPQTPRVKWEPLLRIREQYDSNIVCDSYPICNICNGPTSQPLWKSLCDAVLHHIMIKIEMGCISPPARGSSIAQIKTETFSGHSILSCIEVSAKVGWTPGSVWYDRWPRYLSKKQEEKLSMFGCRLSLSQIVLVTNILCNPSCCASMRVDSLQSSAKCKMQLCLKPDFRTALCSATEALPDTGRIFVCDCTNI